MFKKFKNATFYGLLLVLAYFFLAANGQEKTQIDNQSAITLNFLDNYFLESSISTSDLQHDLESLLKEAEALNKTELIKKCKIALGLLAYKLQKNEEGLAYLHAVFESNYLLSSADSAAVLYSLRQIYIAHLAFEKALEIHMIFKPMAKRFLSKADADLDDNVAAYINLSLGRYAKALSTYRKLFRISVENNYTHSKARYLNDIGVCYERMLQIDSALYYYQKSEQVIRNELLNSSSRLYDSFFLALVEGNQAQILYKYKHKYEEALPVLIREIGYSKKVADFNNSILTLNYVCDLKTKMGNFTDALKYAQNAIFISIKNQKKEHLAESIRLKARAFEKMKNLDSAAVLYRKSIQINDSITNINDQRKGLAIQIAYDVKSKDEKIRKQEQINQEAKMELNRRMSQNQKIIIVTTILAISLLLLYWAFYQNQKREKRLNLAYIEINNQKKLIEESLIEKESLLKEIHHRVKNNLQVISSLFELQALRTDNEALKQAITEGQNRVKSMALIHQKLYQNEVLRTLPFGSYIEDLVQNMLQTYKGQGNMPSVRVKCDMVYLSLDISIPLGLIINELISNILKYAFKDVENPKIEILLKEISPKYLLLKVKDNGVGLPAGFEIDKLNSLGIKLIKTLAKQLNAEWSIRSEEGTVFIMNFKSF